MRIKQLFVMGVVLMFLFTIIPSVFAGTLAFEHDDIIKEMSIFDRLQYESKALTLIGEQRGCSVTSDSSGIIHWDGQTTFQSLLDVARTIDCEGHEALINYYKLPEWRFLGEYSTPPSRYLHAYFSDWAWECYYCPEPTKECVSGERECTGEESYKWCSNGDWSYETPCFEGQFCREGYCVSPSCKEAWICESWSDCTGGRQYRSCFDENNCGTTEQKPTTSMVCTAIDPPPADKHTECQVDGCKIVDGAGTNQCITNSDCTSPIPPPNKGPNIYVIGGIIVFVILGLVLMKKKR